MAWPVLTMFWALTTAKLSSNAKLAGRVFRYTSPATSAHIHAPAVSAFIYYARVQDEKIVFRPGGLLHCEGLSGTRKRAEVEAFMGIYGGGGSTYH